MVAKAMFSLEKKLKADMRAAFNDLKGCHKEELKRVLCDFAG